MTKAHFVVREPDPIVAKSEREAPKIFGRYPSPTPVGKIFWGVPKPYPYPLKKSCTQALAPPCVPKH